jgi:hypothetical protein
MRLYSLEIKGTTFSGHPTRTTLGNSMRTLSYCLYMYWKITNCSIDELITILKGKHDNIRINVAGDDVMICGASDIVQKMYDDIYLYYGKSVDDGMVGLG